MKNEKKTGYRIILSYLIISMITGLSLWQIKMQSNAPIIKPKPIKLTFPDPLPQKLELQPEVTINRNDWEHSSKFEAMLEKTEDQPIPDISGETFEGQFYRTNVYMNPDFQFKKLYQRIQYPQIAKDSGIEANLIVRVYINEKGEYENHKVLQPAHPIFSQAVEREIIHLKIKPFMEDGRGRRIVVNLPFSFELR